MPAARESLLNAAYAALAHRSWSTVRMVDVAATAGVSRQTLYNEFGSKDGLARALVRREADGYLAGVDRALAAGAEPRERLTRAAEWTATAARDNPLVRAMLTGCWTERLPTPAFPAAPSSSGVPAQRRADGPLPSPTGFLALARDRAVTVLAPAAGITDPAELARLCELVMRIAFSCVTAPPAEGAVADLVRAVLEGQGLSGPSPTSAAPRRPR